MLVEEGLGVGSDYRTIGAQMWLSAIDSVLHLALFILSSLSCIRRFCFDRPLL